MSNLRDNFQRDLEAVINRNSLESGSNTPDFILARYLLQCLGAFDIAVNSREKWYSREKIEEGNIVKIDTKTYDDDKGIDK